jgi:hypothetical protein
VSIQDFAARRTHGFPVRFQNASAKDETGCSPARCARRVAFLALNRFRNRLARRIWDRSAKHCRRCISQVTPCRTSNFLNRLSARLIDSRSPSTIRTLIDLRLLRLTRCRLKELPVAEPLTNLAPGYSAPPWPLVPLAAAILGYSLNFGNEPEAVYLRAAGCAPGKHALQPHPLPTLPSSEV